MTPMKRMLFLPVLCLCIMPAAFAQKSEMEPTYLEKRDALDNNDLTGRIDLVKWCKEHGFIREMLDGTDDLLKVDAQNEEALKLLLRDVKVEEIRYSYPELSRAISSTVESAKSSSPDRNLAAKMRNRTFKMTAKSVRFNFFTDLDKERVQDFIQLLNPYYVQTRGFFRISKGEQGIRVFIFSKRIDYLVFFNYVTQKSGEHTNGFFSYNADESMLCFYDDPDDQEGIFNTAKHECTHLLVKHCMQGAELANWLNEGFACYFADNGLDWKGSDAASCLLIVQHKLKHEKAITLQDLMNTPYEDFDFSYYAFAWSWICYLRTNPETKDRLSQLFFKLRDKARSPVSDEWEDDDWEVETNSRFQDIFGSSDKLQAGWNRFAKTALKPKTCHQHYSCARAAFHRASGARECDPELTTAEKVAFLRQGEEWLQKASATEDPELKAKVRLLEIYAVLARSKCMKYSPREITYAASLAERKLNTFLADPAHVHLAALAGKYTFRLLQALDKISAVESDVEPPCDYLGLMEGKKKEYEKQLDNKRIMGAKRKDLIRDLSLLRLQMKVMGNLIALAKSAYFQALSHNPTQRSATAWWLFLAMDFAPQELEEVFPYLVYQVEIDPDDWNLSAMAAAYAGTGKKAYARTLLDKAYSITLSKSRLKDFADYIE